MRSNPVELGVALAHQGGWDEVLLIGAPIAIIVTIFAIAKKKVDQINARHATERSERAGESEAPDIGA